MGPSCLSWAVRPTLQSNSSNCLVLIPHRQLGNFQSGCFPRVKLKKGVKTILYSIYKFLYQVYRMNYLLRYVEILFAPFLVQRKNSMLNESVVNLRHTSTSRLFRIDFMTNTIGYYYVTEMSNKTPLKYQFYLNKKTI